MKTLTLFTILVLIPPCQIKETANEYWIEKNISWNAEKSSNISYGYGRLIYLKSDGTLKMLHALLIKRNDTLDFTLTEGGMLYCGEWEKTEMSIIMRNRRIDEKLGHEVNYIINKKLYIDTLTIKNNELILKDSIILCKFKGCMTNYLERILKKECNNKSD